MIVMKVSRMRYFICRYAAALHSRSDMLATMVMKVGMHANAPPESLLAMQGQRSTNVLTENSADRE
jgi:hypothetical protein